MRRVNTSKAVVYRQFGKPLDVLEVAELPLPQVGPGMVKVRLLAASINPSDFGMILGSYGKLKELPAVAGREGVGEVIEVGAGVDTVAVGERVRFPEEAGVWQTAAVVPAAGLWKIPTDIPVEMAAMAWINPPTAWRILRDGHFEDGAWVIQNAANSAVGLFVIQMARNLGLHTINVVRREELIEPLKKLGGDVVVTEESGYEKDIAALTGGEKPAIALNSVGGASALRLINALGDGGRLVTFGAMSFEPIRFPTRQLIFNDISLEGFWLDRWFRQNSRARIQVMFDRIFALMREGKVTAPVAAKFGLSQFRDAIASNNTPRLGKVLLMPD